MCIKVQEKLVEEKNGVVNCVWCVKEKKCRKETHEKNFERKEKWKERKNTKQRMCMIWKKNRSIGEKEAKIG